MNQNDRVEEKIDRVLERLAEHGAILASHGVLHESNAEQLRLHIARTNALEEHMDAEHRDMKKNLETALLPIRSVKWIAGVLAVLGAIASTFKDIIFK
jgi:hypothetical protein